MSHQLNFLSFPGPPSFQLALLCLVAAALVAYLARTKRLFHSGGGASASLLGLLSRTARRGRPDRSPLLDLPGPPALPLIGAKWCFWRGVGKYGHLQGKRQTNRAFIVGRRGGSGSLSLLSERSFDAE